MASRAHPRSRGENARRATLSDAVRGSSPLTRGKLFFSSQCGIDLRLIPAHAGKTHLDALTASVMGAHPRSRGENSKKGP